MCVTPCELTSFNYNTFNVRVNKFLYKYKKILCKSYLTIVCNKGQINR